MILAFSIYAYCANPAITLSQASGGIAVASNAGSFGSNLNALGLGVPAAGVSTIVPATTPPINGTYYYSPINVALSSIAGTGLLTAYASANFAHPVAFVAYICTSGCTVSANYTQLSLSSASPYTIAAAAANNSTTEVWLAVFVSTANGSGASGGWAGADSLGVTFTVVDSSPPHKTATQVFTLNLTAQTAVGLWLGTASGGLTVSAASDFAMNFSSVNGLGISPAAGLTATSVSGGYIYHTPYTITPVYSGFTATSPAGTVTVQLQTAFGKPAIIYLEDSPSSGGPYNQITSATTVISPTSSNTAVTRYLGLFVSNANGAGTFTGTDSSTLSYTLTAP